MPEFLYKYRALDIRSLSALAKNNLCFVDCKFFNDPFDCHAHWPLNMVQPPETVPGLRVCSFSAKRDDLLMWGHYADSHRGFCIEFRLDGDKNLPNMCFPVKYQNEYYNKGAIRIDELTSMGQVLTKSTQWSYEEEWRAFIHVPLSEADSKLVASVSYQPTAISGVIFGMRMPKDHRQLIRAVLSGHKHVTYYSAEKNKECYSLDIKELEK